MADWYRKENGEIDREKVIDELERDLVREPDEQTHIIGTFDREAVEGALELLKALEPRVMTLEEVLSFDSAIYMDEAQNTVCLKMLYCYEVGRGTYDHGYTFVDSDGDRIYYPAKDFNKTWRCWTSRPTNEQRKAVKWE